MCIRDRIYGGQPVFLSSGQLIFLKCVAAEFLRIGIIRHYRCGKHRDDRTAGAYVSRHAGSGESDPADIPVSYTHLDVYKRQVQKAYETFMHQQTDLDEEPEEAEELEQEEGGMNMGM